MTPPYHGRSRNRTVLVSRRAGIAQSITIALAGEGATVTLVARRVGSLHLVAAKRGELESRAIRYPVDILEEKEIRDLEKQDR